MKKSNNPSKAASSASATAHKKSEESKKPSAGKESRRSAVVETSASLASERRGASRRGTQSSKRKERSGGDEHVPSQTWSPRIGWAFVVACAIIVSTLFIHTNLDVIRAQLARTKAMTVTGPDKLRAKPQKESAISKAAQDGRVDGKVPEWYAWSPEDRRKQYAGVLDEYFQSTDLSAFSTKKQLAALEESSPLAEKTVLVRITPENTVEYVRKWEPENKHTRFESLRGLMEALVQKYKMKPVSFLVKLDDAGGTGDVAAFTSIRQSRHQKNTIPFPIGNSRGQPLGYGLNFTGWDAYVYNNYLSKHSEFPWMRKNSRAVFRGNFHMSEQVMGSCWEKCLKSTDWTKMSRGAMFKIASTRPDLFDVKFTSKGPKDSPYHKDVPIDPDAKLNLFEFQAYKVILNVGANVDWAERVRNLLHLNSALMKHEVKQHEWFYPLMQPFVHYIPFKEDMSDLIEQQQWAVDHDTDVQQIASNGVEFATSVLSESGMLEFAHMAIVRFTKRQKAADTPPMKSLPTPLPKRF